ncbi:glycosyltransferase family 2 protein [Neolewinella antarctica]|uniref:GT2 family glycosyltransferase n=1 Tax=Neolewinella antarctica TaxID=442734 RepID=A0ABX0XCC7_9BACT|nr:glycosyltransferase family 2 protein [Neolewinella antarctica]NJC26847.1 GT2 family glycosyltransferase [Neolewinella antarctica]
MQLSVVIVNYNVRYFLEQALLSVERAVRGMEAEVFVVDNNSVDNSVTMVRERFPWVEVIANEHNPGFAVANNQAIVRSSGKYVLILNPDTVVEEDTFRKCFAFMEANPVAGAVGVRMIDGTGQFLPESKRGLPTPWVAFTKAFGLARLFSKSPRFNGYHLGYLDEHETHEVGALAGAYMWMRSSALEKIGLLDEAFFMYGEDIDWSYRMTLGGYKNYYFPETTIIHYKGESTKRGSLNYVRVFYQAMIIFARKHFTGRQGNLFVLLMQVAIYVRALMTVVANVWRAFRFPLLDATGIYLGLLVIKLLWAGYHFGDVGYFNETINYVHFPAYTLLWITCVFLGGGYEKPFDLGRLFKSLGIGTLVLFSIYGLLPELYRPSRALLLLGAAWAASWMLIVRGVAHLATFGHLNFATDELPKMLIVGTVDEGNRALSLLQRVGARRNYLGRISVPAAINDSEAVGRAERLADFTEVYRAEELLFCSKDISNHQIQTWMSALGPAISYRILPEDSHTIIGSQGKNRTGTLYTIDVRWRIDEPVNRRGKWLLDRGLALLLLLTWPLHALFTWRGKLSFKNILGVLTGKKSWVGYAPVGQPQLNLPKIKPGVLNPAINQLVTDEETLRHLNVFYARDYSVGRDLAIVFGR